MQGPDCRQNNRAAAIESLIDLIGEDATFRLVERFAGTRTYIPHNARGDVHLAELLGREAAAKLAAEFGGLYLRVPLAKPFRIKALRQSGLSYAEIALRVGCTEVTVFEHLKRLGVAGAGAARQSHTPRAAPMAEADA